MNEQKQNIWIDTDLAVGKKRTHKPGYCDVDDGYAVLQLLKNDQITISGISTVFGNTSIENAYEIAADICDKYATYEIPYFKGAEAALDPQKVEHNEATLALAEKLKNNRLKILAIGPATNVAIVLLKNPELAKNIEEVVLVAGRRKPTDYFNIGSKGNRAPDLNFDLDNLAFEVMFQAGIPVTLCPFEISSKVWITDEDLQKLAKSDSANQWLANHSEAWLNQWLEQGAQGFNPFDVLASHYLIAPELIKSEMLSAKLELHLNDQIPENPNQQFKNYLLCGDEGLYKVKYCFDVADGYHQALIESLTK
ncbi:hypothetical protein GCM10027429_29570 [Marivirga atlantica]|uniref:Nucleoside hydrolase n=1 Tax=Marivirga atlantica TaxID=1548457 RepID=A0A937DKS4_9BACT|nr:nucleoside hydrolase [Marivirga atlantica]MBL0766536.1 nucleoside hydrolase [Marivirga atlantica]